MLRLIDKLSTRGGKSARGKSLGKSLGNSIGKSPGEIAHGHMDILLGGMRRKRSPLR
jgi:hypothetical protein